MGLTQSILNFFSKIFGKKPMRFFMIGLDAAGKTTILYQLKLREMVQATPTVGFNIETVKCQNLTFTLWDMGGAIRIRELWHHYYPASKAAIFVFDSKDRDPRRIKLAAEELHGLSSEIAAYEIPLLIFANKQDCEGAMSLEEVNEALQPQDLKQKKWYIQPCSAKTREGLSEGFGWLGSIIYPKEVTPK